MAADLAVDLVVVVAEEEAEEEEEVDLAAEVVAEDLEVRGGKCCCSEGVCSKLTQSCSQDCGVVPPQRA